jgi:polyisoprenoid-binding protein YceI
MNTAPWILLACPLLLAACSKDPPAPAAGSPPSPATSASAPPKASAGEAPRSGVELKISRGKSTFLIDAPLEKIKGQAEESKGKLSLDPADLSRTRGEVSFRLTSLKTTTFGDADKDSSQTDHARNWMQVGAESKAEDKAKYEWATFTITSVEVIPTKLQEAKEESGARVVKGKVSGDFTLHGVTSKKTLAFTATLQGPPERPTRLTLKTEAPFEVSLKEHDIKPRDSVGSFLNGALEKIGKKIDDRVQVSLEVEAGS